MLQNGQDPIEVKQGRRAAAALTATKAMTFSACGKSYIESHRAGWSEKSTLQWITSLDIYAHPVIGSLPVSEIDTGLVLKILQPIWNTKTETASRLRAASKPCWTGLRSPATGQAKTPQLGVGTWNRSCQPRPGLPRLCTTRPFRLRELATVDARALEFLILTVARSGEALGARWSEIDLRTRAWTVPAARMKGKREHRVPLSNAVVELLGALPGPHDGPVFPGRKAGQSINRTRLLGALRQINATATAHGFRSSFRDWAGDCTDFARDVVEAALVHAVGDKTEAAYRRGDALEKRRKLMAAWGTFCSMSAAPSADIVELHRA
jgi:integrase